MSLLSGHSNQNQCKYISDAGYGPQLSAQLVTNPFGSFKKFRFLRLLIYRWPVILDLDALCILEMNMIKRWGAPERRQLIWGSNSFAFYLFIFYFFLKRVIYLSK